MRWAFILAILGFIGCILSCQGENETNAKPGGSESPVSVKVFHFADPERPNWSGTGSRPLVTTVWYPTKDARETDHEVSFFKTGRYADGAAISDAQARYPLILLSHGTGGSAASMAWFAVGLARQGYLVAAVNHHGNTGAEDHYTLPGFVFWWERPKDISKVLDLLLADHTLGPHIDASRIGVAGFSIGGYTALAVAGARLNLDTWRNYSKTHPDEPLSRLPPELSSTMQDVYDYLAHNPAAAAELSQASAAYQDNRIKAAFVMAPVLGPIMTKESLNQITIPISVVAGDKDDQSLWDQYDRPMVSEIPGAHLEVVKNVSHYMFLCEGTFWGQIFNRNLTSDVAGYTRGELHSEVVKKAGDFFDSNLKIR